MEQAEPFLGRERELATIWSAWADARHGRPAVVVMEGDTGTGKTRLVQEFYRAVSAKEDPDGYWPDDLGDSKRSMDLVPRKRDGDPATPPPWLWLAIRCDEAGGRNGRTLGDIALQALRPQVKWHLDGLFAARRRRAKSIRAAKSGFELLISFALPGSNTAFELAQQAANASGAIESISDIIERIRDDGNGITEPAADIASTTIAAIEVILGRREGSVPIAPAILVIDDIHWADPTTVDLVDDLLQLAWKRGWPLLVLVTAWPETLKSQRASVDGGDSVVATLEKWETNDGYPKLVRLVVSPLGDSEVTGLIRARLPNLDRATINALALHASGDLDLLNDYLDELEHSPGWIDDEGRFQATRAEIANLPSEKRGMAIRRLRSCGLEIATALAVGSSEGSVFHTALHEVAEPGSIAAAAKVADEAHHLVKSDRTEHLGLQSSFRRHEYYVHSKATFERLPDRDIRLQHLAENINAVCGAAWWSELAPEIRWALGNRLLELVVELDLVGPKWSDAERDALFETSQIALAIGEPDTAASRATKLAELHAPGTEEHAQSCQIAVRAALMRGDLRDEEEWLDRWRVACGEKDIEFLASESSFYNRTGNTAKSVASADRGLHLARTSGDEGEIVRAHTQLATALFYAGSDDKAMAVLKDCESTHSPQNHADVRVRVAHHHSSCLVAHDLELNLVVARNARLCISEYEQIGDVEAALLSRVNLGDALWGSGRLRKATSVLRYSYSQALDIELPHAIDIAAICLANVLADDGHHAEARVLYDEGIELATSIQHDWDRIYGQIYLALLEGEEGNVELACEQLLSLKGESAASEYRYLESLATGFGNLITRGLPETEMLSASFDIREVQNPTQMLLAYEQAIRVTSSSSVERRQLEDLLSALGEIEGIKGRKSVVVSAIAIARESGLLTPVELEFVDRWEARFCRDIPSAHDAPETVLLKQCDHQTCEARCCYDGVYLSDDDRERIVTAVENNPDYFSFLPEAFIVEGNWQEMSGAKTAVRPHEYSSPDFPRHFTQTRCIFADQDGACSLQRLAEELNEHRWKYKPLSCWLHPFRVSADGLEPPPGAIDRDPDDRGSDYSGYVSFTPCGQERNDGAPWDEVGSAEAGYLQWTRMKGNL